MLKNSGTTTRSGFSSATSSMYLHALATFSSRASLLLCIWMTARRSVLTVPPSSKGAARPARPDRAARATPLNSRRRRRRQLLAVASPLDELPGAGLGDELAVVDDHLPAHEHGLGHAGHLR